MRAIGPLLVAAASAPGTEMGPDYDTARTAGDVGEATRIRTVEDFTVDTSLAQEVIGFETDRTIEDTIGVMVSP